jgi:hypothetical protein
LQAFCENAWLNGITTGVFAHDEEPCEPAGFPEGIKEGNAEVTLYWQANPSRRLNPDSGNWEPTGKVFDEYVLAYYQLITMPNAPVPLCYAPREEPLTEETSTPTPQPC